MKSSRIILAILFSACYAVNVQSQGNYSVHFGPSFPISEFASDDLEDEDAGGATVGLNLGVKYSYPLTESGLGLFGGVDLNYNGLKKDVKDDVEELYGLMGITNADIKYYKYINVPITAGLNYTYQADEMIGVFANAGLALNFLKITNMELKASGETVTVAMDLASSVGFTIGGGILINQKISISVDYLALGKHDIEGEVKTTGFAQDIDGEQKVDFITLTLGIKL